MKTSIPEKERSQQSSFRKEQVRFIDCEAFERISTKQSRYLRYIRLGLIFFLKMVRSCNPPQYGRVFKSGQKRLISSAQLLRTEAGATTRNGPQMFFSCVRG